MLVLLKVNKTIAQDDNTENQDQVHPDLPVETALTAFNTTENRLMHLETRLIQSESELMTINDPEAKANNYQKNHMTICQCQNVEVSLYSQASAHRHLLALIEF